MNPVAVYLLRMLANIAVIGACFVVLAWLVALADKREPQFDEPTMDVEVRAEQAPVS